MRGKVAVHRSIYPILPSEVGFSGLINDRRMAKARATGAAATQAQSIALLMSSTVNMKTDNSGLGSLKPNPRIEVGQSTSRR